MKLFCSIKFEIIIFTPYKIGNFYFYFCKTFFFIFFIFSNFEIANLVSNIYFRIYNIYFTYFKKIMSVITNINRYYLRLLLNFLSNT